MSTWGKDFFDNPNKNKVRTELWLPCFEELVPQINNRGKFKRAFRYLGLPGPKCIFIIELLSRDLLNKDSYVIGIENISSVKLQIQKFFSKTFNRYNSIVHLGTFENLCNTPEFRSRFPFDIANIDITGSFHSLSISNGSSFYFEGLQDFLLNQATMVDQKPYKIKEFYLIINSNIKGLIPDEILSDFDNDLTKLLKEVVLKDYKENFNVSSLNGLIDNEDPTDREQDRISITSLNLRLMTLCSNNFKTKMTSIPYCYQGHKEGAKIVSMTFKCEKLRPRLGTNGNVRNILSDNLDDVVEKCKNTNFLHEP